MLLKRTRHYFFFNFPYFRSILIFLLIIGKIVFLLSLSCISDAMKTLHSKDEKTTSCFSVTSSVKKKKIMCVYKSETSRQSLKNVSFYFSKNEVIARAPRLAVGTGTWKSFSASLRLFCVTLNSLPTQLVPEHMFVLQC